MKKNQIDQETEEIKTTQLAAFGLLVGGVLTVFLFLALIVSSVSGTKKAPASEVKPAVELAAPPQPNLATSQPVVADEQSKVSPKGFKPRKRKLFNPTLKAPGNNRDYRTSVTPGKTPKMVQVQ